MIFGAFLQYFEARFWCVFFVGVSLQILRCFSKKQSYLLSPPHCFDTFPVAELRRERYRERHRERERKRARERERERKRETERDRDPNCNSHALIQRGVLQFLPKDRPQQFLCTQDAVDRGFSSSVSDLLHPARAYTHIICTQLGAQPCTPCPRPYRGTSLTRKHTPLGPYRRPVPRVLEGPRGLGVFLWARYPCNLLHIVFSYQRDASSSANRLAASFTLSPSFLNSSLRVSFLLGPARASSTNVGLRRTRTSRS